MSLSPILHKYRRVLNSRTGLHVCGGESSTPYQKYIQKTGSSQGREQKQRFNSQGFIVLKILLSG